LQANISRRVAGRSYRVHLGCTSIIHSQRWNKPLTRRQRGAFGSTMSAKKPITGRPARGS